MGFDFSLVDVFTDRPFGGNRLAVFPDATGIADATMQQLAWEFNFSETTFVLPPSDPSCTCRVRIFTPRQELPFAGHPTVGTAAVLASLSDDKQFVFEEGIGPVRVDVDGSRCVSTWTPLAMRAAPKRHRQPRSPGLCRCPTTLYLIAGMGYRAEVLFCAPGLAGTGGPCRPGQGRVGVWGCRDLVGGTVRVRR